MHYHMPSHWPWISLILYSSQEQELTLSFFLQSRHEPGNFCITKKVINQLSSCPSALFSGMYKIKLMFNHDMASCVGIASCTVSFILEAVRSSPTSMYGVTPTTICYIFLLPARRCSPAFFVGVFSPTPTGGLFQFPLFNETGGSTIS